MAVLTRVDVLNRLLAIHYRSLPIYLRDAHGWRRAGDERIEETLGHVIDDHQRIVELASDALLSEGADIRLGEFPMQFTDLHDLSYDYLLRELVRTQRELVARVQSCVDDSGGDPLALEALGLAKGHLEELQDATRPAPAAS